MEWQDRLIGRGQAIRELDAILERGGAVVVTGAPGVGKSALARVVVRARGGVIVPCRGATRTEEVLRRLCARLELHVPEGEGEHALDRALRALGGRDVLFDDAEEVAGELGRIVGHHASTSHSGALVVASRVRTLSRSATVFEVTALDPMDAAELLALRARRAGAAFQRDADFDALVDALGGLPLAIELAAAQLTLATPAQWLARGDTALGLQDVLERSWGVLDGGTVQKIV